MKGLRDEGVDCSSWKGLRRCSSQFVARNGTWVWRFLTQVQSKETRAPIAAVPGPGASLDW